MSQIIPARHRPLSPSRAAAAAELFEQVGKSTAALNSRPAAKQIVEIIDVKRIGLRSAARRVTPATAARSRPCPRRLEIAAELIVAFAFVGVAQYFERGLNLLKLLLRRSIIRIHVGVILAREF